MPERRAEHRTYEKNPVISDIRPKRSYLRYRGAARGEGLRGLGRSAGR